MKKLTFFIIIIISICTINISTFGQTWTGTARTWQEVMDLLPDNVVGAISPQDLRDLWKTTWDSTNVRARTATLTLHTSNTSNPHSVTATQVGLGNVTNESKTTLFTSPTFTGSGGTTIQGSSATTKIIDNTINVTTGAVNNVELVMNDVGYAGGAAYFRNFTVADGKSAAIFRVEGSTKATYFYGSTYYSRILGNQIDVTSTDANGTPLWLNYQGYSGGTTRFRNLMVGDGKQDTVIEVDGETKEVTLHGTLNGKDADDLQDSSGVESIIDKTANFTLTAVTSDTVNLDADVLRFKLEISTTTEIVITNATKPHTVVSVYLEYTGQPTVSFTPPSGFNIAYGQDLPYTGPDQADVMDKIIIETYDGDTLLIYPAVVGIPVGDL